MSDYKSRVMQASELGADDAPIKLPPAICAKALHSNRFSIVGVLLNPGKQNMKRLINEMPFIWGLPDVVIGRMIDTRKFQFVFPTEEALIRVLRNGPWSFAEWMIVSKRWDSTVTDEDLKKVQLWVQIKGIPPHYLSRAVIDSIGDTFAEVLAIDFHDTSNLTDHVWILVNWNVENPLRFKRKYEFGEGEISLLSFRYDRLGNFCVLCGLLTHEEKECPLYIDKDANNKTEDDVAECDTASGKDAQRQVFTNAFTGRGMCAGPSGDVTLPNSYKPPIDCDKLAETLRYLKSTLGKAQLPTGHKRSQTYDDPQIQNCNEDARYNPTAGWLGGEPEYSPMEKRVSDDYNEEFIVVSSTIEGVCGGKRKREENEKDIAIVDLCRGSEKGKCVFGDLDKQRIFGKGQESDTSMSKAVMNRKVKFEDSESVDSSD